MILSKAQIEESLRQAGFPSFLIPVMAAIGLAESGGNSSASRVRAAGQGQRKPEASYGIFQINVLAHPEYSPTWLMNPINNAKAALQVYLKQGLSAWSTYTNGAYKTYLGGGSAPNVSGGLSSSIKDYSNVEVIGAKNRYLIAFTILVIIFIFAFN